MKISFPLLTKFNSLRDTRLGGEDIDYQLVGYCIEQFLKKNNFDPSTEITARAKKRLKEQCQTCKHTLSLSTKASIEVESFHDGIDLFVEVDREKFNQLNEPIFARCLEPVTRALTDAGVTKQEIDEVILIGGSTRVIRIQELLSEYFNGKVNSNFYLSQASFLKCNPFFLFVKNLCKRINPDEAVAYGAALQGANLALSADEKVKTKLEGLVLMDVTPLSLGIELVNKQMSVIIPRNTSVPYSHTKTYLNYEDNQTFANVTFLLLLL
jgi:L1 cell adhesion molecule like protein